MLIHRKCRTTSAGKAQDGTSRKKILSRLQSRRLQSRITRLQLCHHQDSDDDKETTDIRTAAVWSRYKLLVRCGPDSALHIILICFTTDYDRQSTIFPILPILLHQVVSASQQQPHTHIPSLYHQIAFQTVSPDSRASLAFGSSCF